MILAYCVSKFPEQVKKQINVRVSLPIFCVAGKALEFEKVTNTPPIDSLLYTAQKVRLVLNLSKENFMSILLVFSKATFSGLILSYTVYKENK
jgi:hypothetical protein